MRAAPLFHAQLVHVDDVFIIRPRREVDADAVASLAESIKRIGLQTPITVQFDETLPDPDTGKPMGAYALIAGRHRLEACRKLGMEYIPAIVRDDEINDEIDAEMWEIAENLHRADLTKEERDRAIRRYAELLSKPRIVGQNDPVLPRKAGHPKGVAQKIADETGLSKRTVARALNPKPKPRAKSKRERFADAQERRQKEYQRQADEAKAIADRIIERIGRDAVRFIIDATQDTLNLHSVFYELRDALDDEGAP